MLLPSTFPMFSACSVYNDNTLHTFPFFFRSVKRVVYMSAPHFIAVSGLSHHVIGILWFSFLYVFPNSLKERSLVFLYRYAVIIPTLDYGLGSGFLAMQRIKRKDAFF